MRKTIVKANLGNTGFHFCQVKLKGTVAPSVRVMNFDFRPNTGERPFSYVAINVSAIADAQRNPVIPFGKRVSRKA